MSYKKCKKCGEYHHVEYDCPEKYIIINSDGSDTVMAYLPELAAAKYASIKSIKTETIISVYDIIDNKEAFIISPSETGFVIKKIPNLTD